MSDPPAALSDRRGPESYEIRVRGHLDTRWAPRLGVPDLILDADGTTVLCGIAPDQAALHGLLQRLRDLNLTLVSVTRIGTDQVRHSPQCFNQTKEPKMKVTIPGLIRWAGLAAILAGLVFAGIQPIHPADVVASVTTSLWTVIISLKLAMCLFFLVGITGIYARQAEQAGWLGFAGFALLAVSFWLQTGFVFVELFVLPVVATPLPGFVESALGVANGQPGTMDIGAFVPAYGVLAVCYLLGGLLFGIATVRAAVLPRLPAVLLAVAAVITPAAALLPHALQRYAAVPMGIALIWLGYSLWTERRRDQASNAGRSAGSPALVPTN